MSNFKKDYANYLKIQERRYKVPDKSRIYEMCMQTQSKGCRVKIGFLRTVAAVTICVAMVLIAVKTNIVSYGYDKVRDIVNTYILESTHTLKSKEAETAEMKIEEERMVFEKTFSSVSQAVAEYQLKVMESNLAYAWEEEYTVVLGYGTTEKINGIRIIAPYYIMGDLPVYKEFLTTPDEMAIINPLRHGIYGDDEYLDDLHAGEKYQTPVYVSMYVNVSGEDMEYTVADNVGLNYVSQVNGMEFDIVSQEFVVPEAIEGLNPMVTATCVKDDVIYRLEGRVSVDTMKEIIDSFCYMNE